MTRLAEVSSLSSSIRSPPIQVSKRRLGLLTSQDLCGSQSTWSPGTLANSVVESGNCTPSMRIGADSLSPKVSTKTTSSNQSGWHFGLNLKW